MLRKHFEVIFTLAISAFLLVATHFLFGCTEDEEGGIEIDCTGGPLFEYGPQNYDSFTASGSDWDRQYHVTYTYESDVLVSSGFELYEDEDITLSYERFMTWNDDGHLVSIEYEYESGGVQYEEWQSFTYDESGNLIHQSSEYQSDNGDGIYYALAYAYDGDGRVVEFRQEYPDGNGAPFGWAYEYDDTGRLLTQTLLDAYYGWVLTDQERKYTYDEMNRLAQIESFASSESVWVETFSYDGDSPLVLESERSDGSRKRSFTWEDDVLTITHMQDGENYYREVFEYAKEGDSTYYGTANPLPVYDWVISMYGHGYLNGCAGL